MAKTVKKTVKTKKKKWYNIIAPKLFQERMVGETILFDPHNAVGRIVKVNLMSLTGDYKRQNYNVKLRITKFVDNRLHTRIIHYELVPSSLKRIVRRKQDKLELSIVAKTKDNQFLRIKPLAMTRGYTSGQVKRVLRKHLEKEVLGFVKSRTYEEVFNQTITTKFQRHIKDILNNIYPIRHTEIRVLTAESEEETASQGNEEKMPGLNEKSEPEEKSGVRARIEEPKEKENASAEEKKEQKETKEEQENPSESPSDEIKIDESKAGDEIKTEKKSLEK